MGLIVEDGTGKSDANTYVSLAEADAYFVDHGAPASWSGVASGSRIAALKYATSSMNSFGWIGSLFNFTQALAWPRIGAIDAEGRDVSGIPQRVKDAQCEYAFAHVQKSIVTPVDRNDVLQSVSAGSVSLTWKDNAPVDRDFDYIYGLLDGLAIGLNGSEIPIYRS